MKSNACHLLVVLAFSLIPAQADIISYSDSGTFSAATANSTFSAPNKTWAFAFQADTQPTVLEFGNGGFDFAFSNFDYSLDGSPVSITPSFIRFFTAANGGGFMMCFNGTTVSSCTDALATASFGWPQMYTGTTSAPTLIPGAFTTDFAAVVSSNGYAQPNTTVIATVTAVPEPATLWSLATVLLALGGSRLYRRR